MTPAARCRPHQLLGLRSSRSRRALAAGRALALLLVLALVARGQLGEGDPLPSVRKLGGLLGVNLNTVAKAYRLLAEEGVVELKHGAPARVLRPAPTTAQSVDAAAQRQLVDAVGKLKVRGASEDAVRQVFEDAMSRFYEEGVVR